MSFAEAAAALGVAAVVAAGLSFAVAEHQQNRRLAAAARDLRDVAEATERRLRLEGRSLSAALPSAGTPVELPVFPSAGAGPGQVVPGLVPLSVSGNLPARLSQSNAFGQTYAVRLRREQDRIVALVHLRGGTALPPRLARRLADRLGTQAGAVDLAGGTPRLRRNDGKVEPLSDWGVAALDAVGRVAVLVHAPAEPVVAEGLHRPELGSRAPATMSGRIDMNARSISRADDVTAQTLDVSTARVDRVLAAGTPCQTEREIVRATADDALLVCFGGQWRPQRTVGGS